MDEQSELHLARELAALREKHRFYQVWENTLKPATITATAVPNTRRPQSATKGPRRKSAQNAADTTPATATACAASPLLIEEPVSRGRVRPRSAPASKTRRKSSVQLSAQQQLLSTGNGSDRRSSSDGGARISEELLRQQMARRKRKDQAFARELVGEMRAIAAEYLAMVEDATRFAGMLGICTAFSLCDQQSLVGETATTSSNAHRFDESKVLFSSKLLVKVEQPGASSQPPRYLSLTAFTKEYNALKTKVQRQLEVLPASEAKTMMMVRVRTFRRRNSRVDGSQRQQEAAAPALATAPGVRTATAERNDEEMDDEMLEARFRQLLDDTIERKQQIDEQLQLLKELGWNTFR